MGRQQERSIQTDSQDRGNLLGAESSPNLRAREDVVFDLKRLIHPIDPDTFKREYWEKQPLIVRRGQPDYYRSLLSLADVDRVLLNSSTWSPQIRVLREGKDISPQKRARHSLFGSAADLESLYAEYRRGATIVLQFLGERWQPLMGLCRVLASEFSASFQVNAYLTPAKEKGLSIHYDTHDVFVLQTEGSKRWRLYKDDPIRLPLESQPHDGSIMQPGPLMEEVELHAGDFIYIPRGCRHDAVSAESTSLHLTVGINTITWAALILRAVESVIENDSRFRESLPVGFARTDGLTMQAETRLTALLAELIDQIEPTSLIHDAAQEALHGGQPALEGHFLDLEGLPRVGLSTRVRRRPDVQFALATDEAFAALHFHGKAIQMPAYTEPDLRFISEANEFRAADLPEELDDPGRLVLVQTLIREGFLTISDFGSLEGRP